MKRLCLSASLAIVTGACAGTQTFHSGPTSLNPREQRAMLAISSTRAHGFARFWLRPKCRVGLVKWSAATSRSIPDAPKTALEHVRDEVGRLNEKPRTGEPVFVTVTIFAWQRRWFDPAPRVGYEVVGRDGAGQIIWMGEDTLVPLRELALDLTEPDDLLVARQVVRKLRLELGL
jgi:hypothetical protein